MKIMYTEMSLHPDEFDYFQSGVESDITFCLKELRVTELFHPVTSQRYGFHWVNFICHGS